MSYLGVFCVFLGWMVVQVAIERMASKDRAWYLAQIQASNDRLISALQGTTEEIKTARGASEADEAEPSGDPLQ